MPKAKLWIASPCFYDVPSWRSCVDKLRAELASAVPDLEPHYILIDDSAGADPDLAKLSAGNSVSVIQMPYNMGHQAAIVYALRVLGEVVDEEDFLVTMDGDGEDRPNDVAALLKPVVERKGNLLQVALAWRTYRKETLPFKLGYLCFRTVFRALTGRQVKNGNFAAFRGRFLKELIFHPHFDQCYASAFISLPLQIEFVPLARGSRYFGESKMGFSNLISHGVRMLMPFTERIAIRGVITSGALGVLGLLALAAAFFVKPSAVVVLFVLLCALALFLGLFALLFTTFSQAKAASLSRLRGPPRPALRSEQRGLD